MKELDRVIQRSKKILSLFNLVAGNNKHEMEILPILPGLGWSGEGASYRRNRDEFEKYYIKSQLVGEDFLPSSVSTIFEQEIQAPVFIAPMSGIKSSLRGVISEKDFLAYILGGCEQGGVIGMCGDSFDTTDDYIVPSLLRKHKGIAVCKPRSFHEIKERIGLLKKTNVVAIGIDIDGLAGVLLSGAKKVFRKDFLELKKIRTLFNGPMFIKGVLSVEDAEIVYKSGYDGIVLSNHGGRAIDYSPAPLRVLPNIVKKYKNKMKILIDGGISTGYDVFICLALGADGAMIGRQALFAAVGGGERGIVILLEKIVTEFKKAMLFSNCHNIKDINQTHLEKYV